MRHNNQLTREMNDDIVNLQKELEHVVIYKKKKFGV